MQDAGYLHIVPSQQLPVTKNWLWTSQFRQPHICNVFCGFFNYAKETNSKDMKKNLILCIPCGYNLIDPIKTTWAACFEFLHFIKITTSSKHSG
jgi:hypothetical protein